jgi:hypothetical protein
MSKFFQDATRAGDTCVLGDFKCRRWYMMSMIDLITCLGRLLELMCTA